MSSTCPICHSKREVSFVAKILSKYNVEYLFCSECGLLQTETPYWLKEAYSSAISIADTGLANRNIRISRQLAVLLYFFFDREAQYLDVAGGYGILTRLMRDIGFDFYWHDEFCQNILAKGFERDKAIKFFEAITAFEVIEHVTNPVEFIDESLRESGASTIIFSTELFSGNPPLPNDWWYYTLNTGQHISFFQTKTLQTIANTLSLTLYSSKDIHMLTTRSIEKRLLRILSNKRITGVANLYIKRRLTSKMISDHKALLNSRCYFLFRIKVLTLSIYENHLRLSNL
jgi:Methyltransferase domain